jgi:hypothetical protein
MEYVLNGVYLNPQRKHSSLTQVSPGGGGAARFCARRLTRHRGHSWLPPTNTIRIVKKKMKKEIDSQHEKIMDCLGKGVG